MPSGLHFLFMVQHLTIELVRHCINRRIQIAMGRLREQVETRAKNSPFRMLTVLIDRQRHLSVNDGVMMTL